MSVSMQHASYLTANEWPQPRHLIDSLPQVHVCFRHFSGEPAMHANHLQQVLRAAALLVSRPKHYVVIPR